MKYQEDLIWSKKGRFDLLVKTVKLEVAIYSVNITWNLMRNDIKNIINFIILVCNYSRSKTFIYYVLKLYQLNSLSYRYVILL